MSHRLGYPILQPWTSRGSRPLPEGIEQAFAVPTFNEGAAVLLGCLVLFLAVAAFGGPLASPGPAADTEPPRGQIAFMSDSDGGTWDIYLMDAGDRTLSRVVGTAGRDAYPALSPDGARLSFVSDFEGSSQLYVTRVGESRHTRLTDIPGRKTDPDWSPDGQRIAFACDNEGTSQIYVVGADGSGLLSLTGNAGTYSGHPSWSPDGSRLVFESLHRNAPNYDIYVMHADGTGARSLTSTPASERLPAWSPDGRRIAFMSDGGGYSWDIWVMDADGRGPKPMTFGPGLSQHPSWSPDGQYIAFAYTLDGREQVYVVNVDDEHLTRLTRYETGAEAPFWGF